MASPGGLIDYISHNRETADTQVSQSPKLHSRHRDPTRAGILPPNSIRKRPQVAATRIATKLDQTVKNDMMNMSMRNNNLKAGSLRNRPQQQQQQNYDDDYDYGYGAENNNNRNEEEDFDIINEQGDDPERFGETVQSQGGDSSTASGFYDDEDDFDDLGDDPNENRHRRRIARDNQHRGDDHDEHDEEEIIQDLDATAKHASFLLRRELQNISQKEERKKAKSSSSTTAKKQQQQNYGADSPQIRIPSSSQKHQQPQQESIDNNSNSDSRPPHHNAADRNLDSEFRNASHSQQQQQQQQQHLPLRLTQEERSEMIVTTQENVTYLSPSVRLDGEVVVQDHDENNNNNNNNTASRTLVLSPSPAVPQQQQHNFAAPELSDLVSARTRRKNGGDFFTPDEHAVEGQVDFLLRDDDDYDPSKKKGQYSRLTASCKKKYENEFSASPLGLAVDNKQNNRNNNRDRLHQRTKPLAIGDGTRLTSQNQQQPPPPAIIHVADGRSLEFGTTYHYRWTRDWEVPTTAETNDEIDENNTNNGYKYKSFWDRFETRASCSLMFGFMKPSPEFVESTRNAQLEKKNKKSVKFATATTTKPDDNKQRPTSPSVVQTMPTPTSSSWAPLIVPPSPNNNDTERQDALPPPNDGYATSNLHRQETSDNVVGAQTLPTTSTVEERSVIRRHYLLPGQKSASSALKKKNNQQEQQSTNTKPSLFTFGFNDINNYFDGKATLVDPDNSSATNRLYSVFNTSASWIAERSLSQSSTLRFRGGARWAVASDENDVPYLDSSTLGRSSRNDFFNGSAYLSSVFSDAKKASCVHQPQTAFSLEVEKFVPFLFTGLHTNFFIGGSASCRMLEGVDFLSTMNKNFKQKAPILFSSLVSGRHHTTTTTNSTTTPSVITPAVALSAESRVNRYLQTHQDNNANNFFTSTLNLRAMAECVFGFSICVPLADGGERVDQYSEKTLGPDGGHSARLEFSWWMPLWSFDSFDFSSTNKDAGSSISTNKGKWTQRFGFSLKL